MPRSLKYVQDELIRVAEDLGLDPRSPDFSRKRFLSQGTEVTKHDLDLLGGFTKLKNDAAHLAGIPNSKVQPESRGVELRNLYVRKLERKAATSDYFHDKLAATLQEVFSGNKVELSSKDYAPSVVSTKKVLTLLWSDLHFGVDVQDYEVYSSRYTWQLASRRLAKLCVEAVQWNAPDLELRIVLNGDIFQGVIHLDDSNLRPMTEQIWGACAILTSAIDFLRKHFGKITVSCLPGNHDRMTYKGFHRTTCQRWDSHAHSLYLALKMAFRETDIKFDIPTTGIALIDDLNGGYLLASHGDAEPDPRNVSKKIDTDRMSTQLLKMKAGHAIDKHISVAMFGHWHTPTVQMLPSGSFVIVNGALIGSDPYGQNVVGEYNNVPAQVMFETVVGAPLHKFSIVPVRTADKDKELDSVIPTPVIIEDGQLTI